MTETESTPRRRHVTLTGVALIAQLELRQRVRSTKWRWALLAVAILIAGVTGLIVAANNVAFGDSGDLVFGLVVYFVLFLGLIVSPTLSATSLNGDAKEGTLAPLQATTLPPADIVLGKLLAAWIASLAFVVVAVPFLAFALLISDVSAWAMVTVVLVLAVELLVVCALGIGWSALSSRTPASAVLTYVTVAVLTVVLPILFALSLAVLSNEEQQVTYRELRWYSSEESAPEDAVRASDGEYYVCVEETYTNWVTRTDRTWWLLAVNPFVIVADSAPSAPIDEYNYYPSGVLDSVKQGVRELRLPPQTFHDYCTDDLSGAELDRIEERQGLPPVWPWGLGAQALLAVGAVWLGIRRVAVPYGTLSAGQRVA